MSAENGTLRVRTGAYDRSKTALTIRRDKTQRLARRIRLLCPWIEDSDVPALRAYCELEIVGAALFAGIVQVGAITRVDDGRDAGARRLVEDHRKNRLAASALAKELGLTPAARMAIKANGTRAAFDLASAMARANDEPEDAEVEGDEHDDRR
jgi:hypothetical protein